MFAQIRQFRPALKRNDAAEPARRRRGRLLPRYILAALPVLGFFGLAVWAGGVADKLPVAEDQPNQAEQVVVEPVEGDSLYAYERALAELELREAELEETQAVLAAATTRLERPVHLESPLAEVEVALAKVETQLGNVPFAIRRAQAQLDFAKRNHEAKTALKGVLAGRTIEQAASTLAEAIVSLEEHEAREDLLGKEREALVAYRNALKTQLELKVEEIQAKRVADAKLKAARACVKQAEIQLAEMKRRLDWMAASGPMDGRALDPLVQPGAESTDEASDTAAREENMGNGTFAGLLGEGH